MNERLFRSRHDRVLAGVAGGLAEMWDADPSLIRVVWALLVFLTGGLALLVYIVMAIVVPEEDAVWPAASAPPPGAPPPTAADAPAMPTSPLVAPPPQAGAMWGAPPVDARRAARMEARAARRAARSERRAGGGLNGAMIGGLVLVALGAFFLAREWWPQLDFDWFWPAMLILLGLVLLVAAIGRRPDEPGSLS